MKVRVAITVDVPDWWRREIRRFYGKDGLATRDEVRAWLEAYGRSMDEDLAASAQEFEDEVDALIAEIGS